MMSQFDRLRDVSKHFLKLDLLSNAHNFGAGSRVHSRSPCRLLISGEKLLATSAVLAALAMGRKAGIYFTGSGAGWRQPDRPARTDTEEFWRCRRTDRAMTRTSSLSPASSLAS